jgi:hypothetical protein
MPDYKFDAFYVKAKEGEAGLTVTVDVYSTTPAKVVDDAPAEEVGGGIYSYKHTTATPDEYLAVFKTDEHSVEAKHILSRPSASNISVTAAISATEAASVASGLLALRAYNTFAQSVTSTSTDDLDSATLIWLAIKRNAAQADDDSLVFIEATDGLTILDGAAYATAADGSLTVSGSSGNWTITLKIEAEAMAEIGLRVGSYDAEIKYKLGNDVKVLWTGAAVLTDGIVRAIE